MLLEYLAQLEHSEPTRQGAAYWLEIFASFCTERGLSLTELAPSAIAAYHTRLLWQPHRGGRLYAPHSVDLALRWARAFLRWATALGYLKSDPTRHLVLGRPASRPRPTWSAPEREALLSRPDCSTPIGLRDRALLALFLVGLTRHQVEQLELADYDPATQQLALHRGHRRRGGRELVLTDELAELLGSYLTHGRPFLGPPQTPALFVSSRGGRMRGIGLSMLLARYPAHRGSSLNWTS